MEWNRIDNFCGHKAKHVNNVHIKCSQGTAIVVLLSFSFPRFF